MENVDTQNLPAGAELAKHDSSAFSEAENQVAEQIETENISRLKNLLKRATTPEPAPHSQQYPTSDAGSPDHELESPRSGMTGMLTAKTQNEALTVRSFDHSEYDHEMTSSATTNRSHANSGETEVTQMRRRQPSEEDSANLVKMPSPNAKHASVSSGMKLPTNGGIREKHRKQAELNARRKNSLAVENDERMRPTRSPRFAAAKETFVAAVQGRSPALSSVEATIGREIKVFIATWNVGNAVPDPTELEHWLPRDETFDIIVVGIQESGYRMDKEDKQALKETAHQLKEKIESLDAKEQYARAVRRASNTQTSMDVSLAAQAVDSVVANVKSPAPSKPKKGALSKLRLLRKKGHERFETLLLTHYGTNYRKVSSISLGDMRLMVLCVADLKRHVGKVSTARKATGIGGVMGNKGGLMVQLSVFDTELCFLSCHLTAHEGEEKVAKRNQDMYDILKATSNASSSRFDVSNRFHHTFLFGDLNYRIMGKFDEHDENAVAEHREQILDFVRNRDFGNLYRRDQLRREIADRHVLSGFTESVPSFEPTYKVSRDTGLIYNMSRTPSYCDRILWASLTGREEKITQLEYKSSNRVSSSDHKPVYSLFKVDMRKELLRQESIKQQSLGSGTASALVNTFRAIRKSPVLQVTRFKVLNVSEKIFKCHDVIAKFSSPVLLSDKSGMGREPDASENNFLVDLWVDVPTLHLKVPKEELLGKHIYVTLWDKNNNKRLLGQACLSLDPWATGTMCLDVHLQLIRYGQPCGEVCGMVELVYPEAKTQAPMVTQSFKNKLTAPPKFLVKAPSFNGPVMVEDAHH